MSKLAIKTPGPESDPPAAQAVPEQRSAISVAYQGAPGAYSEGAALKAVPGCQPLPCEQFDTAFEAISQWLADRAVLPIENSLGGSIHAVYDLLIRRAARRARGVRVRVSPVCCVAMAAAMRIALCMELVERVHWHKSGSLTQQR